MDKEQLIQKWLDHNLDAQELEAFKKIEDYPLLEQMDAALNGFKPDEYHADTELKQVLERIGNKNTKKRWLPYAAGLAAIFLISFVLFRYNQSLDSTLSTLTGQKTLVVLPDKSSVELNALSTLNFNPNTWESKRDVWLEGEAYFKVASGSTFTVHSGNGWVKVLGTEFNVKQRENSFEVVCYEGRVKVNYKNHNIDLLPGSHFLIRDGNLIATEKEHSKKPSWTNGNSTFKSAPYTEVLAEFERQYDVTFAIKEVDTTQRFTGSFVHDNIELALKSITLPLQLTYSKTNRTIVLERGKL
ncbi:MAG TPA: FecR domain-containing protein [Aquaticitalea sp.]|nr:FecR domain-containing protein [Aquaticitalea sp.]